MRRTAMSLFHCPSRRSGVMASDTSRIRIAQRPEAWISDFTVSDFSHPMSYCTAIHTAGAKRAAKTTSFRADSRPERSSQGKKRACIGERPGVCDI